ncbi:MAG: TonB-dependent receptor [Bacteroidota bacterium]|nr:TonB-dependent receptor [Bacteroidota bacterium]
MKIKIALLLCILSGAYSQLVQAAPAAAPIAAPDSLSIWVNGLCGMCETRIEKAALKIRGVNTASWDAETRMLSLSVDPDKFKEKKLHYNIASVGHDTRELLAPDPVYEALPMCCKYRDFATHEEASGVRPTSGNHVSGLVVEMGEEGEKLPLLGANVYWMNTGAGTTTDQEGRFSIEREEGIHMLVISYVGYGNDTIHVDGPAEVEVEFSRANMLEEVRVVHRVKPTSIDYRSAYNIQNIHEKELTKAACCNLSESFETNPSVDAGLTDAVTGTRKIEMLGLAGPYVQIMRENMPDVRGLSALYGLTYVPGTWIEGIQLNMGAGSVANGFESMTGQINVELRKPENSDRLFLNLYGNSDGKMEANVMTAYPINEQWSGSLLLHGNSRPFQLDHNTDGFVDHPTGSQLVALKRFKYSGENGLESQLGIKVVWLDQVGGQMDFDPDTPRDQQSYWGSHMNTRRLEGWAKIGKVFENKPYASMGFQLSGLVHRQDAYFGLTDYLADQQSLYANLIYQSILGNTNHQYRTGISFQADSYDETVGMDQYQRQELVPGAFLEYTFNHMDIFTAVAGFRADYHNIYGTFFTPRLHLRYEPVQKTVIRASAGRGQKAASIFVENMGIFATSRSIHLDEDDPDSPYGLEPEVAWSYGLNVAQGFRLGATESVFKLDYYHTRFSKQVVVDLDRNPQEVHFYNLDGASWSNSIQAQLDMEPVERYDIRLAYRFNDVRTTYGDELMARPMVAKHRAFVNMAYSTKDLWSFDITWSWQGAKRIPSTESNPEPYRLDETSPAFSLVNLQLGKTVFQRLELYAGIENLFGFVQEDPILASEDPFGPWFDSSLIWGPVFGRKFYGGLRFRIN